MRPHAAHQQHERDVLVAWDSSICFLLMGDRFYGETVERIQWLESILRNMLLNYDLFGFFEFVWGLIGVAVALGTVG